MSAVIAESPSQRKLAGILAEDKEPARRLREEAPKGGQPIHRTKLWTYATGRGKPSAPTAAFIERVTGGRVKANGWETDRVEPANDNRPRKRKGAA